MKKNQSQLSLSVVVPCYNEEANLRRGVLIKVADYFETRPYPVEVIVVDDGSTDQSRELIEKVVQARPGLVRLVKNPHQGKPFALKTGIGEAKKEIILLTDMDQSTPIEEIDKLLPYFGDGYDLVIGSRGKARENFPWYRRFFSWGFRVGRQLVVLKNVADTQCGFKAGKREVVKRLFAKLQAVKVQPKEVKGWRVTAYDVELLFLAEKAGYRIAEVQVRWRDEDLAEGKERNFLKESREMAYEVMRVVINNLLGRYQL